MKRREGPILTLLFDVTLSMVTVFLLYMFGVAFFGLYNRSKFVQVEPQNRFCIVIPAHNEEAVIGQLLDNLQLLDYPQQMYDVFVVADNCSDGTAEVASQRESVKVLERDDLSQKGKGAALGFAFNKLGFTGHQADNNYDAVAVFDADNLVQPNFLQVMNTRLANGEELIQCFLDSKNPSDTWISSAYSIMFWLNSRFLLLSRYNLSLCAFFMGTGMCISSTVLKDVGWNTKTLTEDLEYSMQALLSGYRTTYTHQTRVYDEKPLTFKASCRQRLRWARGQVDVFLRYGRKILRTGFHRASPMVFEAGVRLFQILVLVAAPLIMWMHGILGIDGAVMALLSDVPYLSLFMAYFPYWFIGMTFVLDGHPVGALKYAMFYPVFALSWLVLLAAGLMTVNRKEWMPTEHTRALSISDVASESMNFRYAYEHRQKRCLKEVHSKAVYLSNGHLPD